MRPIYDWDSGKFLGYIPQVPRTYQRVGNMNEHQLIIAETTYGGRAELEDPKGIMDYGSLIYVALERAKTAREAIAVIADLANTYGYYSSGESFSIADTEEVWVMDLIGKGPDNKGIVWVARRVPDGYICSHANQARISTFPQDDPENCMFAPDVISFAREKGYFTGEDKDFSFCDAYAPLDFSGMRACEARSWAAFNILCDGKFTFEDENGNIVTKEAYDYIDYAMGYDKSKRFPLFVKPSRKISVKDVADVMRDHYEGTPMDMTTDIGAGGNALPYRWRPMGFGQESGQDSQLVALKHVHSSQSLRLFVKSVLAAEFAVLLELKSVRVVLLVLHCVVVSLLALSADQSDLDSYFISHDIGTSHKNYLQSHGSKTAVYLPLREPVSVLWRKLRAQQKSSSQR